ncbi:MAG: hypothetical protein JWM36_2752 [Hyphomicrobiales bacterium]|nr:hypothetical protein [Hyphomicrobiales bacterium]
MLPHSSFFAPVLRSLGDVPADLWTAHSDDDGDLTERQARKVIEQPRDLLLRLKWLASGLDELCERVPSVRYRRGG